MTNNKTEITVCLLNPQGHVRWQEPPIAEHPDTGGQIVYILELSKELAKAGCKVDIFTRFFDDSEWTGYNKEIEEFNKNLRIVRIKCGPENKFLCKEELWPFIKDFASGIRKFYTNQAYQPDVITSHYADAGLTAAMLKKDIKKSFVHTGHSLGGKKMDNLNLSKSNFDEINNSFNFHLRTSAERITFKNSHYIIASTQEEVDKQYGHKVYKSAADDKNKFHIIPPGISPEQFFSYKIKETKSEKYQKATEKLQKQLEKTISQDRINFPCAFSAARFDAKKNPSGLLMAYADSSLLQEKTNLLIIAGNVNSPLNPENRDKLKENEKYIVEEIVSIIEERKLQGKVCFSPGFDYKDEMPYIYRYAGRNNWIFVNPALHEPFGLTIVEAMVSGLPVVATKFGGPVEILDRGKYGILADTTNPVSLASSIEQLLDPDKWRDFSEKGMERVKEKFTWKTAASGYIRVFDKIINEGLKDKNDFPIPEYFLNQDKKSEQELINELKKYYF